MKRSQPGSKSCYSGEGVISRTRPLGGGCKAVSKGRVLFLISSTTSTSGGWGGSGGEVLILILVATGCIFPQYEEKYDGNAV